MKSSGGKRSRKYSPSMTFDYKDAGLLSRFVTEFGKIVPRRITGLTAFQQRQLTSAVKRARSLALLGYCNRGPADNA